MNDKQFLFCNLIHFNIILSWIFNQYPVLFLEEQYDLYIMY